MWRGVNLSRPCKKFHELSSKSDKKLLTARLRCPIKETMTTTASKTERPPLPTEPASFLLYGSTGAGKTPQIGVFAKWLFKETGGKLKKEGDKIVPVGGLRWRHYCTDEAGWRTIQPLINVGIIEAIDCLQFPHPWVWYDAISMGMVPDLATRKWVRRGDEGIGGRSIDGITGISDQLLIDMAAAAARGVNIGGEGAFSFDVRDENNTAVMGPDGKPLKIGSNNRAHYMQAQSRVLRNVGIANRLLKTPFPSYLIMTATDRRAQDEGQATVTGVQAAGKALAHELPRLFTYTFHLTTVASNTGPEEHRLYFVPHLDPQAGNAKGMANRRLPINDVKKSVEMFKKLPTFISPASIVDAYQLILKTEKEVEQELLDEFAA